MQSASLAVGYCTDLHFPVENVVKMSTTNAADGKIGKIGKIGKLEITHFAYFTHCDIHQNQIVYLIAP